MFKCNIYIFSISFAKVIIGDFYEEAARHIMCQVKIILYFFHLSIIFYKKAFQLCRFNIELTILLLFTLGMTHFFPYQAYTLGMTQANGYVWFLPGWFKDRWYDIDYLRVRIIIFIEINCSFTLSLLSLQEKKKEDLASGQEVGDKVIVM